MKQWTVQLQDTTKRKAIDAAREEARLVRISNELADEEERKRQWRVARGEVLTLPVDLFLLVPKTVLLLLQLGRLVQKTVGGMHCISCVSQPQLASSVTC